jgi:hypothetical protein
LPTEFIIALFPLAVDLMGENFPYWEALAAYVASYLVLAVNLKYDFGGFFHQTCSAARALVVISLATEFAEKLRAFRVLAFHWEVNNLMTLATKEVFIHLINRWLSQPQHIEALLLFLSWVLNKRRGLQVH